MSQRCNEPPRLKNNSITKTLIKKYLSLIQQAIDTQSPYLKIGQLRPNSTITEAKEDSLVRDGIRQEANLTLDQEGLTTTQDSLTPDEVALTTKVDTFKWSQPTLDQALTRWYKLGDVQWSYVQSVDAPVCTFDVSNSLFNIAALFDRIKRYRYWRAGIKVRLQVNSTPFHYGSIFAAIIPSYNTTEAGAPNPVEASVWSYSGQPCSGFLCANTGKPLELSCPYQNSGEYLTITQQTEERPFYLKTVVMNPLKVSGGATNPVLTLTVMAQFTDMQIMGPSEITANSSSKRVSPADREQRNALKQGTMGKVAGAVSDVASKLTTVPIIGSIASAVAPVASAIGSVLDYFGWDKPTSLAAPVFNIDRGGRGLTSATGQDIAEPLGLKFDQKLSTEACHFGLEDVTTRSFLKLIQTPMWLNSFTIPNNQVVGNVFKRIQCRPWAPFVQVTLPTEEQRHDYLSWYSQFFSSCRGGYRYYIHFDTSSYTTASVRITYEPSNQAVAVITDGGDSFSRIVDINGATSIVTEVPYCYPRARMPIAYSVADNAPSNGQLLFSLVNPIQTNGSSADVIWVNVFRCAADDFRFYQPHVFTTTKTYVPPFAASTGRIMSNSLVEQMASQTVTSLGDGPKVLFERVTEDEEVQTHNDFLHRYHLSQPASLNVTPIMPQIGNGGDAFYWMGPFRAYRGSTRHLFGAANSEFAHFDGIALANQSFEAVLSMGCFVQDLYAAPIEVPYNNNIRYLPTRLSPTTWPDGTDRNVYTKFTAGALHLWAAGDDFTLGLRRAPLLISLTVP